MGFASCQALLGALWVCGMGTVGFLQPNEMGGKTSKKRKKPDIVKTRRGGHKSTQIHSNKLNQSACTKHQGRNDPDEAAVETIIKWGE